MMPWLLKLFGDKYKDFLANYMYYIALRHFLEEISLHNEKRELGMNCEHDVL